ETFSMTLNAPGAVVTAGTATISILDDEPQAQLGFVPASYQIAESGGSVTLTVKRTGDTTGTASVNVAAISGGAISGSDFAAAPATLTFGPGETSKTFVVAIVNDADVEGNETFTAQLSAPVNGQLSAAVATITIVDDDPQQPPASSIGFDPSS